jgi:hypothetical protein
MRMRSFVVVIIALVINACGGATADERTHTTASAQIEVPDPIDRDIRSAGVMEGTGGERLAQFIFDAGMPIAPPSGLDAGRLPIGPIDASVPPIGIPDSSTIAPLGRDAGLF